ncbi:MAG: hypothetical protein AAFX93_20490 [Verrucomicrobiota bacterium]
MNFDLERYRADLAPLNLSRDKEDQLIQDLWQIVQVLYDNLGDPNFYPLHLAIANEAFDALAKAIEVQSGGKSLMQTVKEHHEKLAQTENSVQKEDI